jgi:hypothetical protein
VTEDRRCPECGDRVSPGCAHSPCDDPPRTRLVFGEPPPGDRWRVVATGRVEYNITAGGLVGRFVPPPPGLEVGDQVRVDVTDTHYTIYAPRGAGREEA